ncbi:hypothetical protein [Pseudozobellia sp. WGM2]|uniref:hypothetical protein n=1 Tax=Pseudozobellia sp. WGM2 TaxID=2787625 RepID=UPI001ADF2D6C|nr:hypothetical protein [Pseudozobellia sp. WGM2]
MQPDKFDEYIKNRLDQRKLQPSTDAWERIQKQLEISPKPVRKPYFKYTVAASLIGFLLVSISYFKDRQGAKEPVKVVDTEKMETQLDNSVTTQESEIVVKNLEMDEVAKSRNHEQEQIVSVNSEYTSPPNAGHVMVEDHVKDDSKEILLAIDTSEVLIDTKIEEVIAQVELLEKGDTTVSDAEIDSLLQEAQREIVLQTTIHHSDGKVDAMALLAGVEDELNQSFRDQIFETLKDRFLRVKTAVATRNQ